MLKVVHYINQFFGQIGGEDKADTPPLVKEGPVGPGLALQQALGDQGKVVATIICGDSYFNEHVDEALAEVLRMVEQYQLTCLWLVLHSLLGATESHVPQCVKLCRRSSAFPW